MFSTSYIEMCIAGRDEIEFLRMNPQFQQAPVISPKSIFQAGDHFHHPLMKPDETKSVAEANQLTVVRAVDNKSYPHDECAFVPKREQLMDLIKQMRLNIGTFSSSDTEEDVLARYMRIVEKKTWNKNSKQWISSRPAP